jgi:hypothetical protein
MKKTVLALLLLGLAAGAFGQRLSTVGIAPFEAGDGAGAADAANLTRQVIGELSSWGTLTVLEGAQAETAEYIVRGKLAREGGQFVLSAATIAASSRRTLNESKERAAAVSDISVFSFCAQVVENVPYPNYLLGKWQSLINTPEGPLVCIMEFRSDRSVRVEQYDSWEHKQNHALKYEGYGSGTYAYAGYSRRTMNIRDTQGNSRQSPVDATVSINLTLEETLTEYAALNQSGLRLLFNDARSAFELLNAGLPCGRNFDGAAVYPFSTVAFTQFTKIQ